MITTVTGKNQVTIPARIATALQIAPGTRLEWEVSPDRRHLRISVLPDRGSVARDLRGAGRRWKTANRNPDSA